MKRILSAALAALLLLAVLPVCAHAAPVTINVYNWGQYISDGSDGYIDVNAAVEEATGIHVNYITFDSNESMYTKLKTGGASYDVIIKMNCPRCSPSPPWHWPGAWRRASATP